MLMSDVREVAPSVILGTLVSLFKQETSNRV